MAKISIFKMKNYSQLKKIQFSKFG